ncbi:MAG: hypothetical protein F6K11_06770 [Leptolyngbya sp. SIO3F4]|nr:hypothetical protein [Leptolyngbya sp. SIO3F4]
MLAKLSNQFLSPSLHNTPRDQQHHHSPLAKLRLGVTLSIAGAITLSCQATTSAQTAISNLNAAYEAGDSISINTTNGNPCQTPYTPCDGATTLNFGVGATNNLRVTGFTAGTDNYSLIQLADKLEFRRINNSNTTGERQLIFFERSNDTDMRSSYVNTMEEGLLSQFSNRGIDNVFANNGGRAINNIERIDYIISGGLTVPAAVQNSVGFLILERGGNDPFNIAAITSLDPNGDPASFGNLITVSPTFWGFTGFDITTTVMRREENESVFRPSHSVNSQAVDGVFISLNNLGFSGGETIYGYALFPNDINNANDLLGLSDFPTDTSADSGEGGLDLVAGGGIYLLDSIPSVSGTLYEDTDGDNNFTNGEGTLPNAINVILYQDNNNNGTYDVNEEVQTVTTLGGNGGYIFAGVTNGTYRIFVDTGDSDIPSNLSLGTPNDIEVVVSGIDITGINFGFDRGSDYGDAPDTYGTDATAGNSSNSNDPVGASHTVISGLQLGTAPDTEVNGQPTPNADGDGVEDDGISLAILTEGVTSYSIPATDITTTNTTGGAATLHAWVDFDGSGTFDADEYASQTVQSGNSNPDGALTWSGSGVSGLTGNTTTYARFRLTTDSSLNANTPGGAASNGEVEDYQLTVAPANNSNIPNTLLVKRITALNGNTTTVDGDNLSIYLDEVSNPYDDNTITVSAPLNPTDPPQDTNQWPNITTNLLGGIDGGKVTPNDEIEYTIYFLSAGSATAENVLFCDYVPTSTNLMTNAYLGNSPQATGGISGADLSVELLHNGTIDYHTGINDGDRATYFAAGIDPANSFSGIDCEGDGNDVNANPNGAIVVNLGDLPDATSDITGAYGYVRFKARVE